MDLTQYRQITRLVGGAKAMFGVLRADEGRSFDIQASHRVRALNAPELMVRYSGSDAIPDVNGGASALRGRAAITKYVSFTVAYNRGSLPPLFKIMDNQVTVGLTVQAKQRNKAVL